MSSQFVASSPAWVIPGYLETRDGHLIISGVDAVIMAQEYDTPLFVFSELRIRSNILRLQRAAASVERPVKFCYASKANSNMAVLTTIRDAGIDIEVNSGGELYKALRVGFRPDQIIFTGTSKTTVEIEEAVARTHLPINVDFRLRDRDDRRGGQKTRRLRASPPFVSCRRSARARTWVCNGAAHFKVASLHRSARSFPARPAPSGLLHVCVHTHPVGSQTPDVDRSLSPSEPCGSTCGGSS